MILKDPIRQRVNRREGPSGRGTLPAQRPGGQLGYPAGRKWRGRGRPRWGRASQLGEEIDAGERSGGGAWGEGAGQGRGLRPWGWAFPGLGVAALGQGRLQPLEEPPSTHLRLPEFQLPFWLLLQAKEPLWLEGPLEPGQAAPSLSGHTHLHSARATPPKGARGPRQWGPPGWEAGQRG